MVEHRALLDQVRSSSPPGYFRLVRRDSSIGRAIIVRYYRFVLTPTQTTVTGILRHVTGGPNRDM